MFQHTHRVVFFLGGELLGEINVYVSHKTLVPQPLIWSQTHTLFLSCRFQALVTGLRQHSLGLRHHERFLDLNNFSLVDEILKGQVDAGNSRLTADILLDGIARDAL